MCHMMTTIDGKIDSGIKGMSALEDEYYASYTETENKLDAQAWMIGRVTMEMFAASVNTPLPASTTNVDNDNFLAPSVSDYYVFAIDTKGVLRWKETFIAFQNIKEKINLVVLVTHQTPREYLAYLRDKKISYLMIGDVEADFAVALQEIKAIFGIERLLLEGGALLNGSLMAADLIDEISLLVCPVVLNRTNSPSLFERETSEMDLKRYGLKEMQKLANDCVWLRYIRKEKYVEL